LIEFEFSLQTWDPEKWRIY